MVTASENPFRGFSPHPVKMVTRSHSAWTLVLLLLLVWAVLLIGRSVQAPLSKQNALAVGTDAAGVYPPGGSPSPTPNVSHIHQSTARSAHRVA